MSETPLDQLPFTCANCGNQQRFVPAKPQPCVGCRGSRWVLGNDTKFFEWKQSLTVVRRNDRAQLAQIVRGEMLTLASADADPLVDALRAVQSTGWEDATQPQDCGHPVSLRSEDGQCAACGWDRMAAAQIEDERIRAEVFSGELNALTKKCAQAEADRKTLARDVEGAVVQLAKSQNRVGDLEKRVRLLTEQCERGVAESGRVAELEGQLDSANREIEGLGLRVTEVRGQAQDSIVAAITRAAEVEAEQSRERDATRRSMDQLAQQVERLTAERDGLQERFEAGVAHTIEMKRGYESMIELAAKVKMEADDANESLRAELEQARRGEAAMKKANDESWLGKDRVVEMDSTINGLRRELAVANDDLAKLRKETERPTEAEKKRGKADGASVRELAAARRELEALKKQLEESWLSKDAVLALDAEKRRLEHDLAVASDALAAMTRQCDDAAWLRQSSAESQKKVASLESELEVANRSIDALAHDHDDAVQYRDRAIELEIEGEKAMREARAAKVLAEAMTKERDAALLRAAKVEEVESENSALAMERDQASALIAELTIERDQAAPYKSRAIQLELDTEALARRLELATASIVTLSNERDEAERRAAAVSSLEFENVGLAQARSVLDGRVADLVKERDQALQYLDRAVRLEMEVDGVRRKLEVANDDLAAAIRDRDAALEYKQQAETLGAERDELVQRLDAANEQLNSIREKLGVSA